MFWENLSRTSKFILLHPLQGKQLELHAKALREQFDQHEMQDHSYQKSSRIAANSWAYSRAVDASTKII